MRIKKLLLLINIIVTGLILWLGYGIASTWIQNSRDNDAAGESSEKQSPSQPDLAKKAATPESYKIIINRDIFDAAKQIPTGPVRDEKEMEVSKRDLELKGTVVGDNGPSYAVILDRKKRTQSLYYLDDSIEGAKIIKIMPDLVVLDTGGNEEILPLIVEDSQAPAQRPGPPQRADKPRTIRPKVQLKK